VLPTSLLVTLPRALPRALLPALLAALALAGCGLDDDEGSGGSAPRLGVRAEDEGGARALGFPVTATKNTTRVGGGDPIVDAAGVASAVFPASSDATRPKVVAFVDKNDWQGAVAGAALSADPIGAPLLLTDGESVPPATQETLDRLKPPGSKLAKDAQVILVGDRPPAPEGPKAAAIEGSEPYRLAAEIDQFIAGARGESSSNVVVTTGERAEYAMPASAWAGYSGDPVLFVKKSEVPSPTRVALEAHRRPNIYLLGPASVISPTVEAQLKELGRVRRIAGETAVAGALEFVRFQSRGFGWGLTRPGNNYSLANTRRPLDAAAAAALASNGIFAPLLLTDTAERLPFELDCYLLDVQPGYEDDPQITAGSNYVWILGDESAVSRAAQGRIDQLSQLIRINYEESAARDEQAARECEERLGGGSDR
jgi:hypothetical protein